MIDFYPILSYSSKVIDTAILQEMNRRMPLIQCSLRLSAVYTCSFHFQYKERLIPKRIFFSRSYRNLWSVFPRKLKSSVLVFNFACLVSFLLLLQRLLNYSKTPQVSIQFSVSFTLLNPL